MTATLDAPRCWGCAYGHRHTHHDDTGRVNARHYQEVNPMQYRDLVDRQEEARQRLHDHLNGTLAPEVSDEDEETEDGDE